MEHKRGKPPASAEALKSFSYQEENSLALKLICEEGPLFESFSVMHENSEKWLSFLQIFQMGLSANSWLFRNHFRVCFDCYFAFEQGACLHEQVNAC